MAQLKKLEQAERNENRWLASLTTERSRRQPPHPQLTPSEETEAERNARWARLDAKADKVITRWKFMLLSQIASLEAVYWRGLAEGLQHRNDHVPVKSEKSGATTEVRSRHT